MSEDQQSGQTLHVRRCHKCGHVNCQENAAIHYCQVCHKHLSSFYFFDESKMITYPDNGYVMSIWNQSLNFNPLIGISTYWSE